MSISILLSYDLFSFALSQKPRCVERLGSSFSQTPALWIPIHILCLLVTFFTRSIFHVVDQFSERLSRKYRYDSLEWRGFCLGPSCFDVIVWSSESYQCSESGLCESQTPYSDIFRLTTKSCQHANFICNKYPLQHVFFPSTLLDRWKQITIWNISLTRIITLSVSLLKYPHMFRAFKQQRFWL